jgi:hypothetical protein
MDITRYGLPINGRRMYSALSWHTAGAADAFLLRLDPNLGDEIAPFGEIGIDPPAKFFRGARLGLQALLRQRVFDLRRNEDG